MPTSVFEGALRGETESSADRGGFAGVPWGGGADRWAGGHGHGSALEGINSGSGGDGWGESEGGTQRMGGHGAAGEGWYDGTGGGGRRKGGHRTVGEGFNDPTPRGDGPAYQRGYDFEGGLSRGREDGHIPLPSGTGGGGRGVDQRGCDYNPAQSRGREGRVVQVDPSLTPG